MVSRHSSSHFLRPLRALPPPVLFVAMLLLQQGSLPLSGQTPSPPREPGLASQQPSSQAAHASSANPAGARHPVAQSLRPACRMASGGRAAGHGVSLQGDFPALKQSAVDCMRRGDFAAAIQAYKQALKLDPNDPDLKLGLARALSLSGHNEESKGLYQQLLSKT